MKDNRNSLFMAIALCTAFFAYSCGTPTERSNALVQSATLEIVEAQNLTQQAENADEGKAKTLLAQAEALKEKGLKHFDEAVVLDSTNINAYWNYGIVLQGFGYLEEALANFEKGFGLVVSTNPPPYGVDKYPDTAVRDSLKNQYNGFVLQLYTTYKNLKQYEKALKYASDPFFRNFYPSKYPEAALAFGYNLIGQKKFAEAIDQFKIAQEAAKDARTNEGRQTVYSAAFYTEQAIRGMAGKDTPDYLAIVEAYEKAIQVDGENPESYSRLATVCDEAGEKGVKGMDAKAIEVYKTAIEKNPKSEMLRSNFGMLLVNKGKVQDGIGQWKEILTFNPNSADTYQNLAVVHDRMEKTGEANNYYKKFVETAKNDPSKAGDVKAAIERLQKAGIKI
ncbi:MAG: hypothetical protein SFU91_03235 [Chloroherpetonaceae bacterium]|nr:hypothetical protein [Chloroherpetonaceae bacterium]